MVIFCFLIQNGKFLNSYKYISWFQKNIIVVIMNNKLIPLIKLIYINSILLIKKFVDGLPLIQFLGFFEYFVWSVSMDHIIDKKFCMRFVMIFFTRKVISSTELILKASTLDVSQDKNVSNFFSNLRNNFDFWKNQTILLRTRMNKNRRRDKKIFLKLGFLNTHFFVPNKEKHPDSLNLGLLWRLNSKRYSWRTM